MMSKEIKDLVDELAGDIFASIANSNVFWFGSSPFCQVHENMDVDIMIVIDSPFESEGFERKLRQLKHQLLSIKFQEGFTIYNESLQLIVNKCATRHTSQFAITPRYVFGPIHQKYLNCDGGMPITLHFKGPITVGDFLIFAKYFPFHARSIIHNNVQLSGNLKLVDIDNKIILSYAELCIWAEALNRRMSNASTLHEKYKCINKLSHSISIFKGSPRHSDYLRIGTQEIDGETLLAIFNKKYHECLSLKPI